MSALVSLRAAGSSDDRFLRRIFAEVHCPELSFLPLDPAALSALQSLQFDAQQAHYAARYPDAIDQVILSDSVPVGRCWVAEGVAELRLLDLAVRPVWQRRGIGGAVLDALIARAEELRVPIRLSVWHHNAAAIAQYRRRGFTDRESAVGDGGYLELERCSTRTSADSTR